jgi:hypothetical protein
VKIDPKFKIMSNLLNPNVGHLQYLVVFWALSSILATWLCFDHLFKTSSLHLIHCLDVDFANINNVYLDCCFYVNMNYGWYVYLSCITLTKWYQFSSLQNHLSFNPFWHKWGLITTTIIGLDQGKKKKVHTKQTKPIIAGQ